MLSKLNRIKLIMSTRVQTITKIIEQRQPLAQKIEGVEKNLESLASALYKLENHRNELVSQVDDHSVIEQLKEIDTSSIQNNISRELDALRKLKKRFSRNTLNIGVVGRARQGKSRLLQSLTGLTAAEIPDGSGQHCTGVRSTIHHNPAFETSGEVWFHTERSFLDHVITPYYDQLELGAKPITLEEFASKPLPELPQNQKGAEVGAKYEHLRGYHTHLEKYRDLLQEPSPRRIPRDEIREYVAQDNLAGERIYYNYLAVQEVRIVCKFPNAEVGQIALVDLPGLGDTGIGDEERLLNTLGQDIDLVLFVRMPKSNGDFLGDVDVRLYDVARSALVDLPLEKWSFMVFNQTNSSLGDNSHLCESFAADLKNKHIHVSESAIADCADPQEANTKILDRVLNYLAANITSLDQEYASSCQDRLKLIQNAVNAEINKIKNILGQDNTADYSMREELPLFRKLFGNEKRGWWKDVVLSLQMKREELWEQRQMPDHNLENGITTAIQACQQGGGILLSDNPDQEIKERIIGSSTFKAYADYRDELRVFLSRNFQSLDKDLKQSIEKVKSDVADILADKGRLGILTEAQGKEFFLAIAEIIPENMNNLKQGFIVLAEFELSYRGLILHRIRQHLDGLTNVSPTVGQSQTEATLKIDSNTSPEDIFEAFQIDYETAINRIKPALEEFLCEPSQAAYAMIEEFVDNVIRQEEIEDEWQDFLIPLRGKLWPDEFGKPEQERQQRQQWLEVVHHVEAANSVESFQFLH